MRSSEGLKRSINLTMRDVAFALHHALLTGTAKKATFALRQERVGPMLFVREVDRLTKREQSPKFKFERSFVSSSLMKNVCLNHSLVDSNLIFRVKCVEGTGKRHQSMDRRTSPFT